MTLLLHKLQEILFEMILKRLTMLIILLIVVSATMPATIFGNDNVCYIDQTGCKYRMSILPMGCNQLNDESGSTDVEPIVEATAPVTDEQLKKLDALEQKLVKMMEELSIRSLRHIREIRSDLRQMTYSMNSLQSKSAKVAFGSGSGVGGAISSSNLVTQCPTEFVGVGTWKSCYRFSNFEATWHEAREYCSAFGANLLSLDSMKEAYIVDYLIKSNTEYLEPKGWWTSGNYIVRSQRWMWTNHHQLKPIDFSRWGSGEPNARSTMHCMVLYKPAKYYWHDATCSDKHTFICEMEY